MNDLFHGFEFIHEYIYDLLTLTKGDYIDHTQNLQLTLKKLKENYLNEILKIISWEKPKWNI